MSSSVSAADPNGRATLEAYERWARSYAPAPHNPLMRAEQQAMLAHWPSVAGKRTLDLACGSGRYARLLAQHGASQVVAVDFSAAMLQRVLTGARVRASMMRLPFRPSAFDVVIAGLAIGHAPDVHAWMHEVARVLSPGGTLLYSDFHPLASQAGQTRAFKDENGQRWILPHYCHDVATQCLAAAAAGLSIEVVCEVRIGIELTESFEGCEGFYERWHGLPIALIVRARK
jgi:malonyl-CoA O-methyltransferase